MNDTQSQSGIDTINYHDEVSQGLLRTAKCYKDDELKLFQAELGWEEWMEELCENSTSEEISESDSLRIDEYTANIFERAHSR